MNFNRVILVGRLTRDPEIRTTPEGITVARFRIAVNRLTRGEEQADFFDVVAWRNQADFVANYLGKGRLVLVEGRLQNRSWTAQDGTRRSTVEIVALTVRGLDRPREAVETVTEADYSLASSAVPPTGLAEEGLEELPEELDLEEDPFKEM